MEVKKIKFPIEKTVPELHMVDQMLIVLKDLRQLQAKYKSNMRHYFSWKTSAILEAEHSKLVEIEKAIAILERKLWGVIKK